MSDTTLSFEQSLTQLENIVKTMDSGELSLEDSLQAFERGIGLIRACQTQLQQAEQKVQQLIESEQGLQLVSIDDESKPTETDDSNPFNDDIPF